MLEELAAHVWIHAAFLLFVAAAVYAQALTGFALTLILLGLIGVTNLVPLPDAVNASSVVGFCTAATFLWRHRPLKFERILIPTLIASVIGIFAGALILTWLADTAYQTLRLVLGACIVACALLLWRTGKPLASLSSPFTFTATGGLSGLLAGMFSAPGPPLVYLLYRQPMSLSQIRESLMLIFGLGSALRLLIIVPTGQFSMLSLQLAIETLPVVFLVTAYAIRHPAPLRPQTFKALVCVLLVAAGASMGTSALFAIL